MGNNANSDLSLYTVLISCVATLGGFLFGFDSGVINGTVDGLQGAFDSDSVGTGFNVASMLLGCAIGAYFAGRLADRFGRRAIMRVAAVLFIVSAWGSGVAGGSLEFVVYRMIGGLAVGAASILAPAYISEVAPARYRGALALDVLDRDSASDSIPVRVVSDSGKSAISRSEEATGQGARGSNPTYWRGRCAPKN